MKFKVGDRVRVYMGHYADKQGHYKDLEIIEISEQGGIKVNSWDGWYHPKQCRKLVKKKRRSVWLDPTYSPTPHQNGVSLIPSSIVPMAGFVEFREVKKK